MATSRPRRVLAMVGFPQWMVRLVLAWLPPWGILMARAISKRFNHLLDDVFLSDSLRTCEHCFTVNELWRLSPHPGCVRASVRAVKIAFADYSNAVSVLLERFPCVRKADIDGHIPEGGISDLDGPNEGHQLCSFMALDWPQLEELKLLNCNFDFPDGAIACMKSLDDFEWQSDTHHMNLDDEDRFSPSVQVVRLNTISGPEDGYVSPEMLAALARFFPSVRDLTLEGFEVKHLLPFRFLPHLVCLRIWECEGSDLYNKEAETRMCATFRDLFTELKLRTLDVRNCSPCFNYVVLSAGFNSDWSHLRELMCNAELMGNDDELMEKLLGECPNIDHLRVTAPPRREEFIRCITQMSDLCRLHLVVCPQYVGFWHGVLVKRAPPGLNWWIHSGTYGGEDSDD